MNDDPLKLILVVVFGMITAAVAGKHAKNGHWGVSGAFAWIALYWLILAMKHIFTEGA